VSENTVNALGQHHRRNNRAKFQVDGEPLLNESGNGAPPPSNAHWRTATPMGCAAYHRGAHCDERVRMAQWWSDYLDMLRKSGDVVAMKRPA